MVHPSANGPLCEMFECRAFAVVSIHVDISKRLAADYFSCAKHLFRMSRLLKGNSHFGEQERQIRVLRLPFAGEC